MVNVPLPLLAVLLAYISVLATLTTTTGLHSLGMTYIEVSVGPRAVVTWPLLVTVLVVEVVIVDIEEDAVGELEAATLGAVALVPLANTVPVVYVFVGAAVVLDAAALVW